MSIIESLLTWLAQVLQPLQQQVSILQAENFDLRHSMLVMSRRLQELHTENLQFHQWASTLDRQSRGLEALQSENLLLVSSMATSQLEQVNAQIRDLNPI